MTLNEFSKANLERCHSRDGFAYAISDWSESDWMTACMGELGEAANILKKLNRLRDGIPGNKPHETAMHLRAQLEEEFADAFIYLDLLAQRAGVNLEDAVKTKFNKTSVKIGYSKRL